MFKTMYHEFLGYNAHAQGITDKEALTMLLPRSAKKFIHALCRDILSMENVNLTHVRSFDVCCAEVVKRHSSFPLDAHAVTTISEWAGRPKQVHKVQNTVLRKVPEYVKSVCDWLYDSNDPVVQKYRDDMIHTLLHRPADGGISVKDARTDLGM